MNSFAIVSARTFSLTALAELFAEAFRGYFVPVPADPGAFEARVLSEHIHLGDSHVVLDRERPIALSLTARRGDRSRIAGLGVVPEFRRRGLAAQLTQRVIEEARGRGDREVVLECIEQNRSALALYQRHGFVVRRRLLGWEGAVGSGGGEKLQALPLAEALLALASHAERDLPWQLEPSSFSALPSTARAWRLEQAIAVTTESSPSVRVLRALVVAPEARRQGLGRGLVQALTSDRALRVPAIVPESFAAFFDSCGMHRAQLSQLELVHPAHEH